MFGITAAQAGISGIQEICNADAMFLANFRYFDPAAKALINENLKLISFHPYQKTPGTNPAYTEYQLAKYKFFVNNKFNFSYWIYLHKLTKMEHLIDFYNFISNQNYNMFKFTVFSRRQRCLEGMDWKWIMLPDVFENLNENPKYWEQIQINWLAD